MNIDTAVTTASVCLAQNEHPVGLKTNASQKDHAAWLHLAIRELTEEAGISLARLDAIAISAGPGSYTGLRVGMAAAKGLCYALNKPLITVSTLKMMAAAAQGEPSELLCPMIDARRMEVFTAIYDKDLNEILTPTNLIIDNHSFEDLLRYHSISFFGNGSKKFENISTHPNARFKMIEINAKNMIALSFNSLKQKGFADLAYTEPFYGKEFHLTTSKATV